MVWGGGEGKKSEDFLGDHMVFRGIRGGGQSYKAGGPYKKLTAD